ncbi:MAG: serine/threonine protein kinase [Myxococcales bacterium]|nr:serine/threonine protein kinase [Myxococcales bacterium]
MQRLPPAADPRVPPLIDAGAEGTTSMGESERAATWTIFRRPADADELDIDAAPPWTIAGGRASRPRGPGPARPWPPALAWPPARRRDRSGELVSGRYELLRRIGSGGMAEVYAARFLASRRDVALKLLDPVLVGDLELVSRFRHEFLILSRIHNRHLIRAHDMAVTDDGIPYYTMDLIRGGALDEHLRGGRRLGLAAVIALGRQLCRAVAALHRGGVIHRDLKPANVLLAGGPRVIDARVIDLGIARLTPAYRAETQPYMTPPASRLCTGRGVILGTPGYTPPEAGEGPSGPIHDVFALGVLLYRAATGRMPFAAAHGALEGEAPRRFAELDVPPPPAALEEILLAALAPPRSRIASVDELAGELELAARLLGGDERSGARRRRAGPAADPGRHPRPRGLTPTLRGRQRARPSAQPVPEDPPLE